MNKYILVFLFLFLIIYYKKYIYKKFISNLDNFWNLSPSVDVKNNNLINISPSINIYSIMKKYNVIFGCTVRSVERYIENGLKNIDLCGNKFNDYSVIIYENDSNDNTRKLLEENKKYNYHYIFEDNITESSRTMRISNGRNKILDKIKEINNNNYYTYMIMLDLDDVNDSGKFVTSIETCFKYDVSSWDILTGNQNGYYYDLWALRNDDMDYDCWQTYYSMPQTDENAYAYIWGKYKVYLPNQILEVDSAFGGIAIYKLASIPDNCRYVGHYPQGGEQCEHVQFNKCIKDNGGKIYINTDFLTN